MFVICLMCVTSCVQFTCVKCVQSICAQMAHEGNLTRNPMIMLLSKRRTMECSPIGEKASSSKQSYKILQNLTTPKFNSNFLLKTWGRILGTMTESNKALKWNKGREKSNDH